MPLSEEQHERANEALRRIGRWFRRPRDPNMRLLYSGMYKTAELVFKFVSWTGAAALFRFLADKSANFELGLIAGGMKILLLMYGYAAAHAAFELNIAPAGADAGAIRRNLDYIINALLIGTLYFVASFLIETIVAGLATLYAAKP